MKTCKVEGCAKPYRTLGLCSMHYQRVLRTGSTGPAAPLKRAPGTGTLSNGYVVIGKGSRNERKPEHVLVAEKALGRPLPLGAVVHHVNEDRADNRPENLVICPDEAYHKLIHQRMRALEACGHADWRKCTFCKQYDAPDNLYIRGANSYHRKCHAAYELNRTKGGTA